MRVKFAPSRQYILDTLNGRLAEVESFINEDETKLAQLTAPGKLIVDLNGADNIRRGIAQAKETRRGIAAQLAALQSAESPKVLAEFDI